MQQKDTLHLIAELDALLAAVQDLVTRFEATGMDAELDQDYLHLLDLLERATAQRYHHVLEAETGSLH